MKKTAWCVTVIVTVLAMSIFTFLFGQRSKPPAIAQQTALPAQKPWPFHEPEKEPTLTTSQVITHKRPIRLVVHEGDEDGLWRFLDGGPYAAEDVLVATLREIVDHDSTVGEVADLPQGWRAERDAVGGKWKRMPEPKDEGEENQ